MKSIRRRLRRLAFASQAWPSIGVLTHLRNGWPVAYHSIALAGDDSAISHDHTQNWRGRPLAARKNRGFGGVDWDQPKSVDLFRAPGELLGSLSVCHGKIPVRGYGDFFRRVFGYARRTSGAPREARDRVRRVFRFDAGPLLGHGPL